MWWRTSPGWLPKPGALISRGSVRCEPTHHRQAAAAAPLVFSFLCLDVHSPALLSEIKAACGSCILLSRSSAWGDLYLCHPLLQDLLPRVWSDLTISAVRLAQLGESRYKLTSRTVAEHCSVLDALDQTLSQFKRLGVPGGVQDTCRLIWNAGLLLLQPNLRKHVKKTFAAAAKAGHSSEQCCKFMSRSLGASLLMMFACCLMPRQALEEIDSPLNRLRAALHLEVAKADYLDESFPKAAKEVKKGLALDYIAPDEEVWPPQFRANSDR